MRTVRRELKGSVLFEIVLKDRADDELLGISNELGIALSLDEMKRIRQYFDIEGRNPTDIELQALGQAWSEHCCYKSSKPILKKYIFNIDAPQNICIISEDAGVVEFDRDYTYVVALESHNHPSAVEPYGGAATGIGGILRDVVCMGAQPVALIDPLMFGPLDYPEHELPAGVKHPIYLTKGVVSGIRDYGNRVGIPTVSGMVYFHPKYLTNCLVNVGCIGIARKEHIVHSRVQAAGDIFVQVGGRTGRDGIHGVTFASAELTSDSEEASRGAVQLGDPITKEPLIHACMEVTEKGLLQGMKDFGGGGLSCVTGEMALAADLGAEVKLEQLPLKEEGLKPWEIWVSESQERMMLAVKKEDLKEVLAIFKKWDVEATVVGRAVAGKHMVVYWYGEKIFDLDLEFLTGGPQYNRPYCIKSSWSMPIKDDIAEKHCITDDVGKAQFGDIGPMPSELARIILDLLARPNIASRDWIIRQYDHEVRGNTVLNPLQGMMFNETHGDAAVIKPLVESWRGLAITADVNPSFMELSPYWGSCSALDEVCRNLVAVGANPHSLADCLNFGNPEKVERMGELYASCRGLGDLASYLKVPYVSGNVSLYNETAEMAVPPTPVLLGVGMIDDVRKCTTVDFKAEDSLIYLVGRTKPELNGSEYFNLQNWHGTSVPRVDFENLKRSMAGILKAIEWGLVLSCHDLSEGGLAVAAAEMAIGGRMGADIDVGVIDPTFDRLDFMLFSESNTRWLLEIDRDNADRFEKIMDKHAQTILIGRTRDDALSFHDGNLLRQQQDRRFNRKSEPFASLSVPDLKSAWQSGLWKYLG